MQTETMIRESDRDGGLSISLLPSRVVTRHLSLEITNQTDRDAVTIVISTGDKVRFLELLRKITDECLLRVRDEEQTSERDDG